MRNRLQNVGALSAVAAIVILIVGWIVGIPLSIRLGLAFLVIVAGAMVTNGSYVLKRLATLVPTLLLVTLFTFFLQTKRVTPEVVAIRVLGTGANADAVDKFIVENNLDAPFLQQYLDWLSGAVVGDLGTSFVNNISVSEQIGEAIPISLQLMVYAQLLALVISVPAGVYAAYRASRRGDAVVSTAALGFLSIPNFILATFLVYILALWLDLLPATSYVYLHESVIDHFKHMLLPSVSLAMALSATYMRLLRGDMVSTLQESFITTAKAKGVSPAKVLWGHALRPSSFTLLTVFAVNSGVLIGGALIIEIIFIIPGMGNKIVAAIVGFDFLVLQGAVVVLAVGFVLLNFLIDLLYTALDPRIRNVRA